MDRALAALVVLGLLLSLLTFDLKAVPSPVHAHCVLPLFKFCVARCLCVWRALWHQYLCAVTRRVWPCVPVTFAATRFFPSFMRTSSSPFNLSTPGVHEEVGVQLGGGGGAVLPNVGLFG